MALVIECLQGCVAGYNQEREGSRIKTGFRPIEGLPIAGRYIMPGWTGLIPGVSIVNVPWSNAALLQRFNLDHPLDYHPTGSVVRRRDSEGTFAIYTATQNLATAPPGNGWTAGGGPEFLNTYIVNGFWRGGNRTFTAGQLVYRCRPDAQETNDDWAIEVFEANANMNNAGDPAGDSRFTRYLTGKATNEQVHLLRVASGDGTTPTNVGQVVLYNNRYWRCMKQGAVITNVSNPGGPPIDFQLLGQPLNRPLFDREVFPFQCNIWWTIPPRYSDLIEVSTLSGSKDDESTTKFECDRSGASAPVVSQTRFDHVLSWGDPVEVATGGPPIASFNLQCRYDPSDGWCGDANWDPPEPGVFYKAIGEVDIGDIVHVQVTVKNYTTGAVISVEQYDIVMCEPSLTVWILRGGEVENLSLSIHQIAMNMFSFPQAMVGGIPGVVTREAPVEFFTVPRRGGNYPYIPNTAGQGIGQVGGTNASSSPTVWAIRLKEFNSAGSMKWELLAAKYTIGMRKDGVVFRYFDELGWFELTHEVAVGREYTTTEFYADIVMGAWRTGISARHHAQRWATTLQPDPKVYIQDQRVHFFGPKACLKETRCNGSQIVQTCQTIDVADCGGQAFELRGLELPLNTWRQYQDNCQCAP